MIKGIILLAIVVVGPYALNSTDDMKARGVIGLFWIMAIVFVMAS